MKRSICALVLVVAAGLVAACQTKARDVNGGKPPWEAANPVLPLADPPLGILHKWTDIPEPPTPARVRLGRWLFFDKRLSADGTIACATCHTTEAGLTERKAVSEGIHGQRLTFAMPDGRSVTRKTPSLINEAWPLYPNFFWDGRINSIDDLDIRPIANPQAMGSTLDAMVSTVKANGYAPYFKEAFGTDEITKERVGKAIADYQRTRISGNSPWDKWKTSHDETAVSAEVKKGDELFFGKAGCNQCHLGDSFADFTFHNIGIGWDAKTGMFNDTGRFNVTKMEQDKGAFRTPTLREVSLHPPYMHDGSIATLRDVVQHYNKGGHPNPALDPKIHPLNLTDEEVNALVSFMEALSGTGYQDTVPSAFPQAARAQVNN
jgi:cytochrome c peroxidase